MYVRKESRIEGHFLVCFVSLVIMRVLQNLTDRQYTVENLIEGINGANLHMLTDAYLAFSNTNETFKDMEKIFGVANNFEILEVEKLNSYKKELIYNIKKASFH